LCSHLLFNRQKESSAAAQILISQLFTECDFWERNLCCISLSRVETIDW